MLVLFICKFDEEPTKMKALSCPQHFLYYKSMGKHFIAQGQVTQIRPIWLKTKLVQYFMSFLVTSKTEKDPIKKEGAIVSTTFSPLVYEKIFDAQG